VKSQIVMERNFFFSWDTSNLRSCHLQMDNLNKLIFVNNNWPNAPKIGCIFPSNLVEFILNCNDLEKEFEEFESAFEQDEVLEIRRK